CASCSLHPQMESTPRNIRNSKIIFFLVLQSGMISRQSHGKELTLYIGTGGKRQKVFTELVSMEKRGGSQMSLWLPKLIPQAFFAL
ncbi:MAG: hypothetical protein P8P90_06965, partial [Opitutales bacterium]|nr:hypothetical protein [Opitutales bacterium]